MKNKTKAQLLDIIEKLALDNIKLESEAAINEDEAYINIKDTWELLQTAHKKIKHMKRVIKRNAKNRKSVDLRAKTRINVLISSKGMIKAELRGQKRINEINEQALISCENANNDLHTVNRYLEMRVSDLTIKLNEVHNENN